MDNCLRRSIKRAVCSTLNQTLTLRGWITFSFSSSLKRLTKWQTTTEKQYVPTLHFWCRYIKTVQSCQNISPVSQWSDKHIFWHKSCHSGFVKSYMCYALHIDQTVKSCYSFEWHVSKQWHVKQMASSIKRTSIKTAGDSLWVTLTVGSLPARLKQHLRIQYSDRSPYDIHASKFISTHGEKKNDFWSKMIY